MHIVEFTSKFPYVNGTMQDYYCGGSILAAAALTKELAKLGVDITVFTTSKDNEDSIEKSDRLMIYRYSTDLSILSANISFGISYKPMKRDADLVHVHFDLPPTPVFGYRYAKTNKIPLLLTYHGDWDHRYGNLFRRSAVYAHNKFLLPKMLDFADQIICPTTDFVEESAALKPYKGKVTVIPNGIDYASFQTPLSKNECREELHLPIDRRILLFAGSLYPHKGIIQLVASIKHVVIENPDVLLIIVGDGYLKGTLIKLVQELSIKDNVLFAGYITEQKRLVKHYRAADIFVLPSFSESFGMVLQEAAACELPLVVSDLSAFKWLVKDGYSGLIAKINDEEGIANAINSLLENDRKREMMGQNAKKRVRQNSWDRIASQTINLYRDVLSR